MRRRCDGTLERGLWWGDYCLAALLTSQCLLMAAQETNLLIHTLLVNGANRSYFESVSIRSNSFNWQWVVFALHDNEQSVAQFAERSG